METAQTVTAEVRKLLVQSAGNFPDIATVAKQMSISESTLRRRLNEESTNFRAVLGDVTNTLAQRYLHETGLDVAIIANLLGYSDPENFYRAFARWNAMTPAEYRRQQS